MTNGPFSYTRISTTLHLGLQVAVLQLPFVVGFQQHRTDHLFVAGFIGSPPMTFLDGELSNGQFTTKGGSFAADARRAALAAVAGIRPEDCRVAAPGSGKLMGEVYATELMGDHTLVTCRAHSATVTVKADKSFQPHDGEIVGIDFAATAVHLFDRESGRRIN
jgi:multiple sugar transport system ATP-binding protein